MPGRVRAAANGRVPGRGRAGAAFGAERRPPARLSHRAEPAGPRGPRSHPARPRAVRSMLPRARIEDEPARGVPVHELHRVRTALFDPARAAIRSLAYGDGPLSAVRSLRTRSTQPRRPALSRSGGRVSGVWTVTRSVFAQRRADRTRSDRARLRVGALAAWGRARGEGRRRIPVVGRRAGRDRGGSAAGAQAPPGEAVCGVVP